MSLQTFAADKKVARKPNQVVSNVLSVEKIKAVADIVVSQHIVGDSSRLKSISARELPNDDAESVYIVQAINSKGECYSQAVQVFVGESGKLFASAPRMPFGKCE